MRVDHVTYAAEHDGMHATAERLAEQLGVKAVNGGVHPQYGTRNMIVPLAHDRFFQIVEALDHPASLKEPYGQAVRACTERGGGWLGWGIRVDDMAPVAERLGRTPEPAHRRFPDDRELHWTQIGYNGLLNDPQLPFFICFQNPELHPSGAIRDLTNPKVTIAKLTIAGDPQRVHDWLGLPADQTSTVIDFEFIAPHGNAGLMSVTFDTPGGQVTI